MQRIRFIGGDNPTHIKIYMHMHGNEYFVSTVRLDDGVADLRQQSRYDDEPIFTVSENELTPQLRIR